LLSSFVFRFSSLVKRLVTFTIMPLHIYNSLTRKKEPFEPLNPPVVTMYTCGVTVYDACHIGHARSLYIFDIMRRYLEYRGFKVNFVRNITDIDDKIINRANETSVRWDVVVEKYIESYYKDLGSLGINRGILDAHEEPRATRNIDEIKRYIQGLIDKGYGYVTDTGVYFSVRKFKEYGKLSGQSIEQMLTGVRKEADETKKDPLDFALWKKSKPNEPSWPSAWGDGRPGWHIECSVMSTKYLNTSTLDIHAGGRDLIFPHHENEIAQSEAYTGKPLANYWLHHGLLTINGQKMSKSLGNFVTIKDALSQCPADILKIFYLQAHYSSPIDFSWEKIKEVKKAYERITILMGKLDKMFGAREVSQVISGGRGDIQQFKNQFIEYMDDDFNTPRALSVLFDLVNKANKLMEEENDEKNVSLASSVGVIKEMAAIFGLTFIKAQPKDITDSEVDSKINERLLLRKNRKFQEADIVRKELEAQGIILEDAKEGTTWRRKI